MQLCSNLRNTVETLQFFQIPPQAGSIEYLDTSEATAFIDNTFLSNDSNARILCYSNKRVQEYNDYIRSLRGLPDRFVKGEQVVNNTAINVSGFMLRVEQVFTVTHSEEAYRHIILDEAKDIKMEVYSLHLLDPELDLTHSVTVPRYPEEMANIIKYFAKKKDWSAYFHIKNNYPDLRIFDACTVYKSQGSTYDTVFLDLNNIGKCTAADQIARMLYVGASRARKHIYMFGQLPKRLIK
jgi:hypothetical protein